MKRIVERVIDQEQGLRGVHHVVKQLLEELGHIEDGGLRIVLETDIKRLEPIDQPTIISRTDKTFVCMCGYEAKDLEDLLTHIRRHGARRLMVVPENWKAR